MSAPSCLPSRQNTVESRSSEKPALGQATSRRSQRQSGRQNASRWAWEKRRKKLRIVSSLGKRVSPSMVWSTRSARSQPQWAKRCAPATADMRKAVRQ